MHPAIRKAFNAQLSNEKYVEFLAYLDAQFNYHIPFRIGESPVFVPKAMKDQLLEASQQIIDFIASDAFDPIAAKAQPPQLLVPHEDPHATMLAIDFGICEDGNGGLIPQLIELQGFPSLYCYESWISEQFRKFYTIPENFSPYFSGLNQEQYRKRLGDFLLGGHSTENVILLEIEPEKQGTAIDFILTKHFFGIESVCITKVEIEGRKLFYTNTSGKRVHIQRIYNRVIFDELVQRTDLDLQFNLTQDVDVEWVCHPNWFFKISKFLMPFLNSKYVPESRLLSSFSTWPTDLENYVLKPLYSFSGAGVVFNVTPEDLAAVPTEKYDEFMLQRKVKYASAIEGNDGGHSKVEIRMLFLREPNKTTFEPVLNLTRLSKGDLIGVKYNKDKTWVGGTVCFFEQD